MDHPHPTHVPGTRRRLSWTATMLLVIGGLVGSTAIVSADHNPGGRNGTIKVDDGANDIHPNNEPHVQCEFDIDAYGFDTPGTGRLQFYAWPPTGEMTLIPTAEPNTITLANPNHGGSERGYDGSSRVYDGSEMAPGQTRLHRNGYHVKVVFTAPDGARKQKVFWVTPCAYPYP